MLAARSIVAYNTIDTVASFQQQQQKQHDHWQALPNVSALLSTLQSTDAPPITAPADPTGNIK
jgi:hypothetical protein